MVLPVRKFAGSEVVKEQIKRLFALYARLLTDDGGQDAIPQELLRRLSLVKGDHAKLPRKPEGCYGTPPAAKNSALISGCSFKRRAVCS